MNPVLPLFTGSASNLGEEDILVKHSSPSSAALNSLCHMWVLSLVGVFKLWSILTVKGQFGVGHKNAFSVLVGGGLRSQIIFLQGNFIW